mmetsp:Transcript_17272/g.35069  ORF Transcript_17272/g.35069 Transcript_17272/m.35069 type:complete len:108 (-) Transcript_17272:2769-3092(-)
MDTLQGEKGRMSMPKDDSATAVEEEKRQDRLFSQFLSRSKNTWMERATFNQGRVADEECLIHTLPTRLASLCSQFNTSPAFLPSREHIPRSRSSEETELQKENETSS